MDLQRIVIGVDFSPASADAARWAAQHFGRGVELILAHAVTLPEPPPIMRSRYGRRALMLETVLEGAKKQLNDLAASMAAERIRIDVSEGDAARTLSSVATRYEADLLIVGAHGERSGRMQALGTTAQHAVRESALPVLVVVRPGGNSISRILVPVEDDAAARASLQWAALLSDRFNARVTALHVMAAGAMSHALAREAVAADSPRVHSGTSSTEGDAADRWTELACASGIERERVTSEEVFGVPAVEIVSASERNAADLIVIGRRATGNLRRALLGSVTATVLGNPPCNVLVVPAT